MPYSNYIDNGSKGGNVETTTSEGNTKEDAFDDENLSGKQRTENEATRLENGHRRIIQMNLYQNISTPTIRIYSPDLSGKVSLLTDSGSETN